MSPEYHMVTKINCDHMQGMRELTWRTPAARCGIIWTPKWIMMASGYNTFFFKSMNPQRLLGKEMGEIPAHKCGRNKRMYTHHFATPLVVLGSGQPRRWWLQLLAEQDTQLRPGPCEDPTNYFVITKEKMESIPQHHQEGTTDIICPLMWLKQQDTLSPRSYSCPTYYTWM